VIKLFVFLKRKPDLSHDEFSTYWKETHGPLVAGVEQFSSRVRCYVQNHAILDVDVPGLVLSEYDGAAEFWADSVEDLTIAFADPPLRAAIESSAERFVEPGSVIRVVAEEAVQFDRGFGKVKFMGLSRRHPSMSHDEWVRYWVDVHGPMAHGIPEFTRYYGRYVHNYALPLGIDPPGESQEFDGVVEEWVESVADMAQCLREPAYLEVVGPDEVKFVDFSRSHMLLTEERMIFDAREPS
jgi:uncharacterized protein (TIGR02118 family)